MKDINFEEQTCARVRMYLDALLNNALAADTRLEVNAHLARCPACAAALAARQRVRQALKDAIANADAAPAFLRERILKDTRRTSTPAAHGIYYRWRQWRQWFQPHQPWLLAAAAVLLCAFGFGIARWTNRQAAPESALANASEAAVEPNTQLLKLGLRDHVHCAVGRDYSAGPRSFERMAQDLGPDFINLVPLVQARVPADYVVMIAHQCKFEGRGFVHLILSNQQTLLSLILTPRHGAAFDQSNVAQASGPALHQMSAQHLAVAGFETRDYLAFVVSDLGPASHLQIATQLAPAVHDWLARLEGQNPAVLPGA